LKRSAVRRRRGRKRRCPTNMGTLNALIDQLAGLAQEGPVLIILEDVHWADPTTLEFFGRTIPRLPPRALTALLKVTGRERPCRRAFIVPSRDS